MSWLRIKKSSSDGCVAGDGLVGFVDALSIGGAGRLAGASRLGNKLAGKPLKRCGARQVDDSLPVLRTPYGVESARYEIRSI